MLTLRRCFRGTCPGQTIVTGLNVVFDGLPLIHFYSQTSLQKNLHVEQVAKTALGSLKSSFGM